MQLQPVVRVVLTAIAASIAAVTATMDGQPEWLQAVLAAGAAALAAVGIIPPQVPTKTVVSRKRQDGYSIVELLFALILLLVLIVVLFKVLDRI